MADVIFLDQVSKEYRKGLRGKLSKAIENVSFRVAEGEAVGFIGHNGAGKSTTIRILMGLQSPTSGEVLLQGLAPSNPRSRHKVAYVPENALLYDYLTPRETLLMASRCHGASEREATISTEKWLERLGIASVADKRIRQFSKGMVQRTALAMALAIEPNFLILDEPLSGLDPIGRKEIVEILDEYRQSGRGMLFSSHVLTDVEVLADRFLFIHKGKIRVSGSPGALLKKSDESFDVIVETTNHDLTGFIHLYGNQFRKEVPASDLAAEIQRLSDIPALRLITIRSRNTLESAYFRYVSEAEAEDALKS